MENFSPVNRGKVVGTLDGSFSAGPATLALVYGEFFVNGHTSDEQNQNLKGFYLLVAILTVSIGLLAWIFLRKLPYSDRKRGFEILTEPETELETDQSIMKEVTHVPDVTGIELLKRFDFHFLFWSSTFCGGLQLMVQNNITAYLKSFGMENYSTLFTTLSPIAAVVSKFLAGFLSDAIVQRIPRVALLLVYNIALTIVLICCVFWGNNLVVMTILVLVSGMANGALWCLTPIILSEYFGLKYFGRNWGSFMFGNAISGLAFQKLYGWVYDNNIPYRGRTECLGLRCFTWSFSAIAVLSFCSCVFNVGLLEADLIKYKQRQRTLEKVQDINH